MDKSNQGALHSLSLHHVLLMRSENNRLGRNRRLAFTKHGAIGSFAANSEITIEFGDLNACSLN